MKYSKLTRRFAKWVYTYVDRIEWGYQSRDGRPRYNLTDRQYGNYLVQCYWPQKLTSTLLEPHLHDGQTIHYTSNRGSGFALVRLDIDAHEGQTDALEAAEWIISRFFVGAYHEPSKRGHSVYLPFRVGRCRRAKFNGFLKRLQHSLRALCRESNFSIAIEVQGGFTEVEAVDGQKVLGSRAQLAVLPRLWNGSADMDRLEASPVFLLPSLFAVFDHLTGLVPFHNTQASTGDKAPTTDDGIPNLASSWERMKEARFHFTTLYRRDPTDEHELCDYYEARYNRQPEGRDKDRIGRAMRALKCSTFDPTAATDRSYLSQRDELLQIINETIPDNPTTDIEITREDLAIYLYAVTVNSFKVADNPRQQWAASYAFVAAIFKALKPVTGRGGAYRNKLKTLRDLLENAGLIEALDRGYIVGGKIKGVSQKWTIAERHPRYAEFCRFSESLSFDKVTAEVVSVSAF